MTRSQLKENAKEAIKKIILSLKHIANKNPKLAAILLQILKLFPGLQTRLDRIGKPLHRMPTITKQEQLSPRSLTIFDALKNALEMSRGRGQ